MTENEFSRAFSTAFDQVAPGQEESPTIPALPDSCWPVDWACADQVWLEALDPSVKARAESMAVQVLRSLTGYQVGGCPVLVRPCAQQCGGGTYIEAPVNASNAAALGVRVGPWWASIDTTGRWVNTACGCRTACSCTFVPEVVLPGPVGRVVEVVVDDIILEPHTYRVDNGNRLVRTDGGVWPLCQDMAAPPYEIGTFSVVYYQGAAVDGLSAWVAGIMAVEFAKSCTGAKCRLPAGVQSISRMGVSMDIPAGMFENGTTGIREVDAWLRLWNPYHQVSPSQVWSPDLASARVRRQTSRPAVTP